MLVNEFLKYLAVDQRIKILEDDPENNCKHTLFEGITFDLMDSELLEMKVLFTCSTKADELVIVV